MSSQKLWSIFFLTCIFNLEAYAADTSSERVEVPRPLPSILQQGRNDCAINAVAAAIEYLTTPREARHQSSSLPLHISRSGLYTLAKHETFSSTEEWKKGKYTDGQEDYGVSMGAVLLALNRYGCFPEKPLAITDDYSIAGWSYSLQSIPVAPGVLRIGMDEHLDGVTPAVKPALVEGEVVQARELCDHENPFAKVKKHLVYAPIERPKAFTADFYGRLKGELSQGHPLVIGISVSQDFMHAQGKTVIQGRGPLVNDMHVVLLLGTGTYSRSKRVFLYPKFVGAIMG